MEMLQWSKPKSNKGPVFLPGIETYLKQIGQEFPDPQGEKYWSHQESRCSVLRSIEIAKDLRSYLSAKIYYYTRQNPDHEASFYTYSSEFKDSPYGCMHNRATGRKETSHCLRLNLRWETLLNSETVAPQWIRVCGPAQYGLKAARRAPQFSKRWFCYQLPRKTSVFRGFLMSKVTIPKSKGSIFSKSTPQYIVVRNLL